MSSHSGHLLAWHPWFHIGLCIQVSVALDPHWHGTGAPSFLARDTSYFSGVFGLWRWETVLSVYNSSLQHWGFIRSCPWTAFGARIWSPMFGWDPGARHHRLWLSLGHWGRHLWGLGIAWLVAYARLLNHKFVRRGHLWHSSVSYPGLPCQFPEIWDLGRLGFLWEELSQQQWLGSTPAFGSAGSVAQLIPVYPLPVPLSGIVFTLPHTTRTTKRTL